MITAIPLPVPDAVDVEPMAGVVEFALVHGPIEAVSADALRDEAKDKMRTPGKTALLFEAIGGLRLSPPHRKCRLMVSPPWVDCINRHFGS